MSRCPKAEPFGRPLEQRLADPGLDFYCMTNIGRGVDDKVWTSGITGEKRREAGILSLAEEGAVLQPAIRRMEALDSTTKTNTFVIDLLAGDTEYLFFSVNYPPPIFGGWQLVYEPKMFRELEALGFGKVAYRPFDLKQLYEELALPSIRSAYTDPPTLEYTRYAKYIREPFAPYVDIFMELPLGQKITIQEMDNLRSLPKTNIVAVTEYLKAFADCFTVFGYENCVEFAQLMGELRTGQVDAEQALQQLGEDFFAGPRERMGAFNAKYDHLDFFDAWGEAIKSRFEFLSDPTYQHDSWGEWLWRGDMPICCAEGTAQFDIPGGNYLGYKLVDSSFKPFPPGTCGKGWRW